MLVNKKSAWFYCLLILISNGTFKNWWLFLLGSHAVMVKHEIGYFFLVFYKQTHENTIAGLLHMLSTGSA